MDFQRNKIITMVTLLILLIVTAIAVAIHKGSNYDPSEKIEYRKYLINRISEYVAYIAALFMLFIIIIEIIKNA